MSRILPGLSTSFINQYGTPEINFSYIDPGAPYNVDLFISGSGSLNPRLQAGSLFTFQGLGYARFGSPAQETVVFSDPSVRVSGDAHSVNVGERQDGTIDYIFDGQSSTSTYLKDNVGHFDFNTVLLRLRGGPAGSVKFTSLSYSDLHTTASEIPEPGTFTSCIGGLGLCFLVRQRSRRLRGLRCDRGWGPDCRNLRRISCVLHRSSLVCQSRF
ncbi:MAG: hypothetical protein H7Y20_02275 [Bryobacteraceae bacterium]|nr:hypothetical protein [Bryobacteraceae bacterium]